MGTSTSKAAVNALCADPARTTEFPLSDEHKDVLWRKYAKSHGPDGHRYMSGHDFERLLRTVLKHAKRDSAPFHVATDVLKAPDVTSTGVFGVLDQNHDGCITREDFFIHMSEFQSLLAGVAAGPQSFAVPGAANVAPQGVVSTIDQNASGDPVLSRNPMPADTSVIHGSEHGQPQHMSHGVPTNVPVSTTAPTASDTATAAPLVALAGHEGAQPASASAASAGTAAQSAHEAGGVGGDSGAGDVSGGSVGAGATGTTTTATTSTTLATEEHAPNVSMLAGSSGERSADVEGTAGVVAGATGAASSTGVGAAEGGLGGDQNVGAVPAGEQFVPTDESAVANVVAGEHEHAHNA